MPIHIYNVSIFSVDAGESKNGFFANITVLDMNTKKKLELFTKDVKMASKIKELEGQNVDLIIELEQNKFGTRLGDVLDIKEVEAA